MRASWRLPFTFGGPKAPPEFQPLWNKALRPAGGLTAQEINEYVQTGKLPGGIQ
jgi:hypothetical protein